MPQNYTSDIKHKSCGTFGFSAEPFWPQSDPNAQKRGYHTSYKMDGRVVSSVQYVLFYELLWHCSDLKSPWHSRGQRFDPAYLHQTPWTQGFSVFYFCFQNFLFNFGLRLLHEGEKTRHTGLANNTSTQVRDSLTRWKMYRQEWSSNTLMAISYHSKSDRLRLTLSEWKLGGFLHRSRPT